MNIKRILIGVDDSPYSEKAVQAGYEMAQLHGAEVALANIIDTDVFATTESMVIPALVESREENSKELMENFIKTHSNGITTSVFTNINSPSDGILAIASDWKPQLIVLGTHSRTGLNHLLLGSVASQVARQAHCPVLIVPYKDEVE